LKIVPFCFENRAGLFWKSCRFVLKIVPFCFENRAVYEKMCEKNIVQPGRPQMAIWSTRIACWIPKATDVHSEYVTFIAFAQFWHVLTPHC
jgi:hypothetical protein